MKYYQAIKRKDTESFVETWMALGSVIQNKSEREKQTSHAAAAVNRFSCVRLCATP